MSRTASTAWRAVVGTLGTLAMTVSLGNTAQGGAKLADRTFTFTQVNDSGETAHGYYLSLPNVTQDQIDVAKSGAKTLSNIRINPNVGGKPGITVFFENANNGVGGKGDSFDLYIKKAPANLFVGISGYRDKAGRAGIPIGTVINKPGFQFKGDPQINFLQNSDQAVDFQIHNLQYLANVNEISDRFPLLDLSNSFGFVPAPVPDLSVSSMDMESIFQTLPPVDNGKWIYVRGELDEQGQTIDFVEGALYVPEPSSVVLLLIGGASVCLSMRLVRRNGRRAAAAS